jgi:hypothetical protein
VTQLRGSARSTRRRITRPFADVPSTLPPTSSNSTRPSSVRRLPLTYDSRSVTSPRRVCSSTEPEIRRRLSAPDCVEPDSVPSIPSISTGPPAEVSSMAH